MTTTHAQRALITLRQQILNGGLAGGTRLYEVALAQDLGISRTPVRAALSRLAEESLLDRQGGGYIVRSFAVQDVVDTIELRGVLEGTAARLAAERGAPAELIPQMADVIAALDQEFTAQDLDMDEYSRLNSRFHALLSQMSQSPVLQREIERITALPFAAPSAFLDDPSRLGALKLAQEQHRAMFDAILNREGFRAESLAREHARAARRNVELLLSRGSDAPNLAILTG